MRRFFKPFAVLGLSLLTQLPSQAVAEETVYRFSPVNQYDINLTAAYWNPIINYVSEKSGVKLSLKIGRTSADTTSYVLAKEVEFVFSNHLFSPEREKLGWRVFGRRNTPPIQGQIVVPSDSPVQTIRDLQSTSVAFPGPEAFIAYKVPYAHLLNQGVNVNVVFGGNMNGAIAQLFAGKVQAVGGNSQLLESYANREKKSFRILWTSEPYYDLALMASSKVSDTTLKAVANAFMQMKNDPRGREILHESAAKVGLDKDAYFIPSDGSEYASYRRFYQTAPSTLR
ncbi:ABC transporter substrate-binding protein [Undibacterium squillarum]|uniref:ABC transporter substrate-binding protein n=2 Tax=Undibacterium squillarum TaxID=1131567 RepID=A0ABQ2XR84_9BURK|nr:ABC transporter substrate-binding protein [Undibacterium squillarum]